MPGETTEVKRSEGETPEQEQVSKEELARFQGAMEPPKPEGVKARAAAQQESDPQPKQQMFQIDPVTLLRIQLLATEKKLAAEEERSTILMLKEIRRRKMDIEQQENQLLAAVRQKVGAGSGNIRLVDAGSGLCKVE